MGAVLLVLYALSRRRTVAIAGVAWLLYAAYETAMHLRWLCTGECNIRIDLLVIYPLLLVASGVAAVIFVRWLALREPRP